MAEKTCGERISRVEARLAVYEDKLDEHFEEHTAILSKLETIDKELSRYRGFVGGILFAVTAVSAFFKLFGDDIVPFFQR